MGGVVTPRRYEMRTRAATAERTRGRIVQAAIRLVSEQTAAATSMEAIAATAGVSTATVYRHFGDFDALADACARTAFDIAEVPTPEVAAAEFADLPGLESRLRRFIEISCHCYDRAADWLAAERRERHLSAFARTLSREEAALDAIVRGLLGPAGAGERTVVTVRTLVDFPFWHALVTGGLDRADVADVMHRLVLAELTATTATTNTHQEAHDDPANP